MVGTGVGASVGLAVTGARVGGLVGGAIGFLVGLTVGTRVGGGGAVGDGVVRHASNVFHGMEPQQASGVMNPSSHSGLMPSQGLLPWQLWTHWPETRLIYQIASKYGLLLGFGVGLLVGLFVGMIDAGATAVGTNVGA